MKKVVWILSFIFLIAVIPMNGIVAYPEEVNFAHEIIREKTEFAERKDREYRADLEQGRILKYDKDEINRLESEYAFATSAEKKNEILSSLKRYGAYIFESVVAEKQKNVQDISLMAMSSVPTSNDIEFVPINMIYESIERSWTVTSGGQWLNSNCYTSGLPGTVGDPDAFGVGYTRINSTYNSMVTGAYAYLCDETGGNRKVTYYRSDGNGALGFGFRLQDEIFGEGVLRRFSGYKWYGSCTYDRYFASYACLATQYYAHTYNIAQISSITFGIQIGGGIITQVAITVSNETYSFKVFSRDYEL